MYDTWGKLVSIKDGAGNDITNVTTSVGYKNPYRYRGYRYDSETGLYYLNSRYYNTDWGRFINADSTEQMINMIEDKIKKLNNSYNSKDDENTSANDENNSDVNIEDLLKTTNLFAYCGNNPVNNFDPTGNTWKGMVGGFLTVVAGGCSVIGGVILLATPEPTGLTKVGGYLAEVGGLATMGAGALQMADNW